MLLVAGLARAEDFEGFEDRFQFDCNAPFEILVMLKPINLLLRSHNLWIKKTLLGLNIE